MIARAIKRRFQSKSNLSLSESKVHRYLRDHSPPPSRALQVVLMVQQHTHPRSTFHKILNFLVRAAPVSLADKPYFI
jgi:hypothetical protein